MKRQNILLFSLVLLIPVFTVDTIDGQETIAFPGAEGFGMYTTGGRGGRVIEVTTLEDMDRYGNVAPGSFREALRTEGEEPITIVFRVSGIIELTAELKSSRSNMTIAGQTAPGDGICFKDASIKLSGNNLIIRYLRFRPGDETQSQVSALNIENTNNIIVDHCSMSWSIEENMGFYDNKHTTVQWCILSEPLYDSYHSKGPRGYGSQWGGQYASYHHNLFASCSSRSPRINGCRSHDTIALNDFRNNVIYNWGRASSIYGGEVEIYWEDPENPGQNKAGSFTNFVNNYYKPGPGTPTGYKFAVPSYVSGENTAQGYAEWYFSGNVMEGNYMGMNDDNWIGVDGSDVGGNSNIKVTTEHEVDPVTTHTAEEAFTSVLENAGAIRPTRDDVDQRIVNYIKGEATTVGDGIIDSQAEVGGWPEYNTPVEDSIPADTDKDGMPDYWEDENNLNPSDPEDGKIITESGYSNLELYLNSDIPYIEPQEAVFVRSTEIVVPVLYPNPTNGLLYLGKGFDIESIELYFPDGKLILREQMNNKDYIDVNNLDAGIYIINCRTKSGKKIVSKLYKN